MNRRELLRALAVIPAACIIDLRAVSRAALPKPRVIVSEIGNHDGAHFSTIQAWVNATEGDLIGENVSHVGEAR